MSMTTSIYAPVESEIRPALQDQGSDRRFLCATNQTTPALDLDKSWHGLHYLLTRSAWEGEGFQAFLIHGGDLIDLDTSSARVFWPQQVEQIDTILSELSTGEFRRRFNPNLMMTEEIYPQIWNRDPKEDDTLGWLVSYFDELKKFTRTARLQFRCLVVLNEWPAEAKQINSPVSETQSKSIGHFLGILLCILVTAIFYVTTPRSTWPFIVEAVVLYMVSALLLRAGFYLVKQFFPKRESSQSKWIRYWNSIEASLGIQGFSLFVLFVLSKLIGLL